VVNQRAAAAHVTAVMDGLSAAPIRSQRAHIGQLGTCESGPSGGPDEPGGGQLCAVQMADWTQRYGSEFLPGAFSLEVPAR
jgi:hypothetical protein